MLQAFQQVIRREGFKALWKGNGVTIVHRLPYSAVNFWAYEQATQLVAAGMTQSLNAVLHSHVQVMGRVWSMRILWLHPVR